MERRNPHASEPEGHCESLLSGRQDRRNHERARGGGLWPASPVDQPPRYRPDPAADSAGQCVSRKRFRGFASGVAPGERGSRERNRARPANQRAERNAVSNRIGLNGLNRKTSRSARNRRGKVAGDRRTRLESAAVGGCACRHEHACQGERVKPEHWSTSTHQCAVASRSGSRARMRFTAGLHRVPRGLAVLQTVKRRERYRSTASRTPPDGSARVPGACRCCRSVWSRPGRWSTTARHLR